MDSKGIWEGLLTPLSKESVLFIYRHFQMCADTEIGGFTQNILLTHHCSETIIIIHLYQKFDNSFFADLVDNITIFSWFFTRKAVHYNELLSDKSFIPIQSHMA